MQIKVTIIKNNGEEVEYLRDLGDLDSNSIIGSAEAEVTKVQRELLPFLTERLIEEHQLGFVGKKNQEEKWHTRSYGV